MQSTRFSCQSSIKFEFSSAVFFEKHANFKFHENPSRGSRADPCGCTDRRTDMTKLIVTSRKFENESKNFVETFGKDA